METCRLRGLEFRGLGGVGVVGGIILKCLLPCLLLWPVSMTMQELLEAFPETHWKWLFLLQTRFDPTPAYMKLERLPLAWWGLLVRK